MLFGLISDIALLKTPLQVTIFVTDSTYLGHYGLLLVDK